MSEILLVIGFLMVVAGLFAAVRTQQLLSMARRVTVSTRFRIVVFLIRSALGVLLILAATSTDFPLAMKVIGSLLIVSGVVVLLMGNSPAQRLLDWTLRRGRSFIVAGGVVGILLGAFLIYAGA